MRKIKNTNANILALQELAKDPILTEQYKTAKITQVRESSTIFIRNYKRTLTDMAAELKNKQLQKKITALASSIMTPTYDDEWLKINFDTLVEKIEEDFYKDETSKHKNYLYYLLKKTIIQYQQQVSKTLELMTDSKGPEVKSELFWIRKHLKRFYKFNRVCKIILQEIRQLG